jgi:hypothetical protein
MKSAELNKLNYQFKINIIMKTKTYFILLISYCLFSCENKVPTQKPFIIIQKSRSIGYDNFKFVDKNGIESEWFTDDINKYNIGDTIK